MSRLTLPDTTDSANCLDAQSGGPAAVVVAAHMILVGRWHMSNGERHWDGGWQLEWDGCGTVGEWPWDGGRMAYV